LREILTVARVLVRHPIVTSRFRLQTSVGVFVSLMLLGITAVRLIIVIVGVIIVILLRLLISSLLVFGKLRVILVSAPRIFRRELNASVPHCAPNVRLTFIIFCFS
jgi:hypothetical protein